MSACGGSCRLSTGSASPSPDARPDREKPMNWLRTSGLRLACAAVAPPRDGPQWLGPKRAGGTTEKVAAWQEKEAPPVVWRAAVGTGYSSPVVAGGRVFLHARSRDRDRE